MFSIGGGHQYLPAPKPLKAAAGAHHADERKTVKTKIIGFVGSPRKKGNTDILVDTFLQGAAEGGAEVKKHFLADLEINPCKGCFRNCMLKPGHQCPAYSDDMDMILDDMVGADILLFASPIYAGSFSSYMGRLFERCLPLLEIEVIGTPGTRDGYRVVNALLKGKKAVIGLV